MRLFRLLLLFLWCCFIIMVRYNNALIIWLKYCALRGHNILSYFRVHLKGTNQRCLITTLASGSGRKISCYVHTCIYLCFFLIILFLVVFCLFYILFYILLWENNTCKLWNVSKNWWITEAIFYPQASFRSLCTGFQKCALYAVDPKWWNVGLYYDRSFPLSQNCSTLYTWL